MITVNLFTSALLYAWAFVNTILIFIYSRFEKDNEHGDSVIALNVLNVLSSMYASYLFFRMSKVVVVASDAPPASLEQQKKEDDLKTILVVSALVLFSCVFVFDMVIWGLVDMKIVTPLLTSTVVSFLLMVFITIYVIAIKYL